MPVWAGELVKMSDPETLAIQYLKEGLAARGVTAHVATKVPLPRPEFAVRVTRTGGTPASPIHEDVQMTFECWGPDTVQASNFGSLVQSLIRAMDYARGVGATRQFARYRGAVGLLVYTEDPDSTAPRYQFTSLLRTRGQVVE